MPPRIRKYDSGCEKRKKKQRSDDLVQSKKGALNKFIIKEKVSIDKQNIRGENIINNDVEAAFTSVEIDLSTEYDNIVENDIVADLPIETDNVDDFLSSK